jgi:hypothetical protein
MPLSVGFLVEAERLLAVRLVGNDGLGAAIFQPLSQRRAVISLVAEKLRGGFDATDQALGRWTIVRLAAGQQEAKKTAFSICECVDLRVAPSARAANRLFLLPPFPPEAERCALMCVESIICVWLDRPRTASSRKSFSQTPRLAHRAKRL